jgi:ferredoxin
VIKAKQKPIREITDALKPYGRILNVGCGGCVSVCLAGGQKEVQLLNDELSHTWQREKTDKRIESHTVERQCSPEFLEDLADRTAACDCILSMACGAGVQLLSERFPGKPVFPAVNTRFIGVDRNLGWYEEKCRACGECVLGYTGGVCPVTRCAKSIFNGPCGGTQDGKCEVDKEVPCAWYDIYKRLKDQNRLDNILKIRAPMVWQNQVQRSFVQRGYEDRYETKK